MRSVSFALVGIVPLLLGSPTVANSQFISLNTVPLASRNQFLIFPSERLGMGGVEIALDDPLLDPFVNPAKGVRAVESFFFTTPTMYSVGENSGSVITLPAGALIGGGRWFGSGVVAIQQASALGNSRQWTRLSDASATNKFAYGSIGHALANKIAIAASAYLSDIRALDGSERLFAGSTNIDQSGSIRDFRLGTLVDLGKTRALEVLLLHGRVDMVHDITYREWVWSDSLQRDGVGDWVTRNEHEKDVTRTWGLHAGYQQPVGENGWRFGGILTANRKLHPKIPTYEVENVVVPIPRDPGHSWAFNMGAGLSRTTGEPNRRFTFGMDVVFQPAWSHTWAEAEEELATAGGSVIPVGGRTVENRFAFSNVFTNVGIAQQIDNVNLQFGLSLVLTDYSLDQEDLVEETSRSQKEQWTEWTPTWGLHVNLVGAQLHYQGAVRIGNSPGGGLRDRSGGVVNQNNPDRDVLAAPNAPVNMTIPSVWTHQFAVVLPIR